MSCRHFFSLVHGRFDQDMNTVLMQRTKDDRSNAIFFDSTPLNGCLSEMSEFVMLISLDFFILSLILMYSLYARLTLNGYNEQYRHFLNHLF